MKVKVTPRDGMGNPIPGAGSWETDAVWIAGKWRDESTHVEYPASWCEPIPKVVPQEGDIVEDYQGTIFVFDPSRSATPFKVSKILARKPKGFGEVKEAINDFCADWDSRDDIDEQAAYETFLRAILGGAEYGRVEE